MSLPRWSQGATTPEMEILWLRDDGKAQDLTGAALSARLRKAGETRSAVGVMTLTDAACGYFKWALSPQDVAEAGEFEVQFTAAFTGFDAKTFVDSWVVEESI